MPKNIIDIKEKIISILKMNGPSLPIHIAKAINQTTLFTSAFLSELLSDKKIKISNMRIGSSPVYFIQGQKSKLERFSEHLKSKEKEAFSLLKEKKFLKDSIQEPAIRVALREIKDFAIAFKKENEIFWRYFIIPESEFKDEEKIKEQEQIKQEPEKEFVQEKKETPKQELNIFDKKIIKKAIVKKKPIKKKTTQKKNDKFFNKVKEFLAKKSIEILEIVSFSKNDISFLIKIHEQKKLLVAYNKKRIKEEDVTNAYKKAAELNLEYIILSFGEPLKKLNNFIEAIKKLSKIEKIEEKKTFV